MRANRKGSTRSTGLTKDEVLAALRVCAKKLGHVPTRKELRKLAGISEKVVSNRFGSYGKALREAGFDPVGPGHQWSDEALLLDWAAVARKLKKIPTKDEYSANSRHSPTPFDARWKSWRDVGPAFVELARSAGTEDEWTDVVELVERSGYRIVGTAEHREELIGLKESGDRVIRGSGDHPATPRARVSGTPGDLKSRNANAVSSCKSKAKDYRGSTRMNARESGDLVIGGSGDHPATPRARVSRTPGDRKSHAKAGKHRSAESAPTKPVGRKSKGKFENRKLKRLRLGKAALKPGKAVYGPRLDWPGMIFAPLCEDGVIFAFGMVAHRLGFEILRIRKAFPDCEAMREVQPGKWQHTWIEFEQESRNYIKHRHPKRGCDLIVCWVHNWKECPVEVVELSRIFGIAGIART